MGNRSLSTVMAFVLGVPLGLGILALFEQPPLKDSELARYVSHPVEKVTIVLFACALAALLTKLAGFVKELAASRRALLPKWDGKPVPVEAAGHLLDEIEQRNRGARGTVLGQRVVAVLEFVDGRRSANDLDNHLRDLADNDDVALDGSYSLIRFITWAIPILGFLGTVLGITQAVANVTPEVLEKSLSRVTEGLAVAFDTTAVALALTMVVMFCSFVTERLELSLLDRINRYAEEQLGHRFERSGTESSEFVEVVRHNTQVLLEATEKLVQRQANLWGQSLEEARKHWQETGKVQQQQIIHGLEHALERTLASHAERLAEQEQRAQATAVLLTQQFQQFSAALAGNAQQQQATLMQLMQKVTAQTEALARLADGSSQLVKVQQILQQNLNALANAGSFDQAVSSLTAAIHLLTTRAGGNPLHANTGNRIGEAA